MAYSKFMQVTPWRIRALFAIFSGFILMQSSAYAIIDVSVMLQNFAETIPDLMRLVTAFAYVLGFYFIIHGVMLFRKFAEQRTMYSSDAALKGPMLFIFVGAALIYLPTAVRTGFTTFWTNPMPYAYLEKKSSQWADFYVACFRVIELVGVIAFIRGLVMLTTLSGHSQQGTFSKGISYIIGGILCIDLYDFLQMIWSTFGLGELTL